MEGEKIFLPFLVQDSTGLYYDVDAMGNVLLLNATTQSIINTIPMPNGWINTELGYKRNLDGNGMNRSFSSPQDFNLKAAYIIRYLFYGGVGVENNIAFVVYKRNDDPLSTGPTYVLYSRLLLELPQIKDIVTHGVTVNLMEGGVPQFVKAYENTTLQAPCDGSIPENIKVYYDGLLVECDLYYSVIPVPAGEYAHVLPMVLVSEDGDNYGVIKRNPILENATGSYLNDNVNNNFIQFNANTTVYLEGQLIVSGSNNTFFVLLGHPTQLSGDVITQTGPIPLNSDRVLTFKFSVNLLANERFFLYFLGGSPFGGVEIKSGNIHVSFESKARDTSAWGVTLWDLFRLTMKDLNKLASTSRQSYNYGANSELLQQKLNIVINSGDALRASGDSNYNKYFTPYQLGTGITAQYGPTIKYTLKDLLQTIKVILFASWGNQQIEPGPECLFAEVMGYVYDHVGPSQFSVGEVADLECTYDKDLLHTHVRIGYPPQQYDQKAGKYEYNTTLEMISPTKAIVSKVLDLVIPWRADTYGIERLRANIGGTSTTRNDSDNSVFITNVDRSKSELDFQRFYFISSLIDINNSNNTNQRFTAAQPKQSVTMSLIEGSFFALNTDSSIFVFSEPGFSASKDFKLEYHGKLLGSPASVITGQPADFITIELLINGTIVDSFTVTSNAASTDVDRVFTLTQVFSEGDVIYARAKTSLNGEATINTINYDVSSSSVNYWHADGANIPIEKGTAIKMLSCGNVVAPDIAGKKVVQHGFQYYLFNSILANSFFNTEFTIATGIKATAMPQTITYQLFINGLVAYGLVQSSTTSNIYPTDNSNIPVQSYQLGDVVFLLASTEQLDAQLVFAEVRFTSTVIRAYKLFRVQYDQLIGIPNIARDGNGILRTDIPGAPYNIEELTPMRLFKKWYAWFASIFFNLPNDKYTFGSLSKNQYLKTLYNNEYISENSDQPISKMGPPMFYPLIFKHKTNVPLTFDEILKATANAHISFDFGGVTLYEFPLEMSQKPAINETQIWSGRCSSKTDISKLIDLDINGLNYALMAENTIDASFLSSVQVVPKNQVLPPEYHTRDMNLFLYRTQVEHWLNQRGYCQPWQIGDDLPLQVRTKGLSPVVATLYDHLGEIVRTVTLTQMLTNAPSGIYHWKGQIPSSRIVDDVDVPLEPGCYYLEYHAGGLSGAYLQSECFDLREDWPGSLYIQYTNSRNTQSFIFKETDGTQFIGAIRVLGMIDNSYEPKFNAAYFEDQPADITLTGAIPWGRDLLWIGMEDGIPDAYIQKISRIMILDGAMIEGIPRTLDTGAEWEANKQQGNPKKYWSIMTRRTKNVNGISADVDGGIQDSSVIATFDANGLGPNSNNTSNTDEPLIIQAEITD